MNTKKAMLAGLVICLVVLAVNCTKSQPEPEAIVQDFQWQVDQFADLRILRYQVPGFDELTPKQKELIYYLSEAALVGPGHHL